MLEIKFHKIQENPKLQELLKNNDSIRLKLTALKEGIQSVPDNYAFSKREIDLLTRFNHLIDSEIATEYLWESSLTEINNKCHFVEENSNSRIHKVNQLQSIIDWVRYDLFYFNLGLSRILLGVLIILFSLFSVRSIESGQLNSLYGTEYDFLTYIVVLGVILSVLLMTNILVFLRQDDFIQSIELLSFTLVIVNLMYPKTITIILSVILVLLSRIIRRHA